MLGRVPGTEQAHTPSTIGEQVDLGSPHLLGLPPQHFAPTREKSCFQILQAADTRTGSNSAPCPLPLSFSAPCTYSGHSARALPSGPWSGAILFLIPSQALRCLPHGL